MTKIINLFGGPGSGKSTTAAGLFYLMKLHGKSVELVTEFAKRLVWENRTGTLKNQQAYVHAKQLHYLDNVVGKVDFIVTDSPTLLSAIYAPKDYVPAFSDFVRQQFALYDNLNVFVHRMKKYVPVGRTQTAEEAGRIDSEIHSYLERWQIPYIGVPGDKDAPAFIAGYLER